MSGTGGETRTGVLAWAMWFLLAACPSALLLATTNLLCQEVTTVPLLWVLPLALYLLTFILCFDNPRWYRRAIFQPLFAVTLFLTCAGLIVNNTQTQAILLPVLLFFGCMICHGELVRVKPSVNRLTSFYLALCGGGAAGGISSALLRRICSSSSPSSKFRWALSSSCCSCACFGIRLRGSSSRGVWLPAGSRAARSLPRTLAVSGCRECRSCSIDHIFTYLHCRSRPCRRSHVRMGKNEGVHSPQENDAGSQRRETCDERYGQRSLCWLFSRDCRRCALSKHRRFT